MKDNWKPRYSGEGRSGICVCGCKWEHHHLGIVMNPAYTEVTKEGYIPQECEAYGFNEAGGMKYNKETEEWEEHCNGYRDSSGTS